MLHCSIIATRTRGRLFSSLSLLIWQDNCMAGMTRCVGSRTGCLPTECRPYRWRPAPHLPSARDPRPMSVRDLYEGLDRRQEDRARPGAGAVARVTSRRWSSASSRIARRAARIRSAGCSASRNHEETRQGPLHLRRGRPRQDHADGPVLRGESRWCASAARTFTSSWPTCTSACACSGRSSSSARSPTTIRSGSPPPRSPRRAGCSASTSSTSPTSPMR